MLLAGIVSAGQAPSTPAEVTAFAAALESCTAASARTPHPLMTAFVVDHTITGETDSTCGYRQTMPGKMTMVCALTPDGRKLLAADIRTTASGGSMRGGTNRAQPGWLKECEIELPNGKRTPAK